MAEEAKKKADAPAAAAPAHGEKSAEKKEAPAKAAGGLMTKTPVLLGGVMIIEAVVLFAGFKFLGSAPKPAAGAELAAPDVGSSEHGEHGEGGAAPAKIDKKKQIEIQIVDFRAPNKQSGRTFLYDVTIFAVTKAEFETKVKETITAREALIK